MISLDSRCAEYCNCRAELRTLLFDAYSEDCMAVESWSPSSLAVFQVLLWRLLTGFHDRMAHGILPDAMIPKTPKNMREETLLSCTVHWYPLVPGHDGTYQIGRYSPCYFPNGAHPAFAITYSWSLLFLCHIPLPRPFKGTGATVFAAVH